MVSPGGGIEPARDRDEWHESEPIRQASLQAVKEAMIKEPTVGTGAQRVLIALLIGNRFEGMSGAFLNQIPL